MLLVATTANAERPLFTGTTLLGGFYYQGGLAYGAGGLVHRPGLSPVPLTGVRIHERHGAVSYLIALTLTTIGLGLGSVDISQTRETLWRDTTYINGREVVVREAVRETTTITQKTSEAEFEGQLGALNEGLSGGTWLDVTVFAPELFGIARGSPGAGGYDVSLGVDAVLGYLGSNPVILDVGLHLARVGAPAAADVEEAEYVYQSVGLVGRVYVPVTRFFTVTAEWILNFLSLEYLLDAEGVDRQGRNPTSPLKLGVETSLTDYVYLRAQGTLGGFGFADGKLGFQLEAGVRL